MAKKDSLLKNTFMLYLLTGSNYFFGLITVPYLTRVLGADIYGTIGFAMSFSVILQLVLDFGFQLSAVIDIANNQNNHEQLEQIVTSVTLAKLMIIIPSLAIVVVLCNYIPRFNVDITLYLLYALFSALNALVPDFFYRGMEDMSTVTLRNFAVKAVFASCIIVFVKEPSQYLLVPIFYCLGSFVGLLIVLAHMKRSMNVWFTRVSFADVWNQLRRSALFFLSRAASTVYTSFNTIMLGILFPSGPIVGYYSACNTVINAGQQAINPISGSLFPHIVRTKDIKLLHKVVIIGESILIPVCLIAAYCAKPLCIMLFGADFASAAPMLRIMLPLIPISLATYLYGWSGLGALGMERTANLSVVIGATVQMILLAVCWIYRIDNPYYICEITLVTESIVLLVRYVAMLKGLKRMNLMNDKTQQLQ